MPIETIVRVAVMVGCGVVLVALLGFAISFLPSTPAGKPQIAFGGTMGTQQRTTSQWLDLVRKQDQAVGHSTGSILRKSQLSGIDSFIIADPAAAIDLFDAVGEPSPRGRLTRVAEAALRRFETSSDQPSIEDIGYGLNHDATKTNYWALRLLQHQTGDASAYLPRVQELTRHDDRQVKLAAIAALGRLGDLPTTLSFLDDPEYELAAIDAIGAMQQDGCGAAERLVEKLSDSKHSLRIVASLGQLGPCAAVALEPLMLRIAECRDRERADYATAIVRINPEISPQAIGMLMDPSPDRQQIGVAILLQLRTQHTRFLSPLFNAAENMNAEQRRLALSIVEACGTDAASQGERLTQWYARFPADAMLLTQTMLAVFPDVRDLPDASLGNILGSMVEPTDEANRVVAEAVRRTASGRPAPQTILGLNSYLALLQPKLVEVEQASERWVPMQYVHFRKHGATKKVLYMATDLPQFSGMSAASIRQQHVKNGWEFLHIDPPASNPYQPQIEPLKTAIRQAQQVLADASS